MKCECPLNFLLQTLSHTYGIGFEQFYVYFMSLMPENSAVQYVQVSKKPGLNPYSPST